MPPKSVSKKSSTVIPYDCQDAGRKSVRRVQLLSRTEPLVIDAEEAEQNMGTILDVTMPDTEQSDTGNVSTNPAVSQPDTQLTDTPVVMPPSFTTTAPRRNSTRPRPTPQPSTSTLTRPAPQPSTSALPDNSGPSMQQFIALQDSLKEMRDMMYEFKNANNNNSQNVTVPSVNPSVVHTETVNHNNSVEASFQIQQAVDEHLEQILGQPSVESEFDSKYDDISRPIDYKVTDKLRNMIWSDQYVDLSLLIDLKAEGNEPKLLQVVSGDGNTLQVAPPKSKKISQLGQWCDAFLVYMTVYCRKFPHKISHLTTYMKQVKTLALRDGDYISYDEEFRYLRQRKHCGWELDSALWLEFRDKRGKPKSGKNANNNSFRPNGGYSGANGGNIKSSHPAGYCYKYHNTGHCKNQSCSFKHVCYLQNCGNRHPVFQCSKYTPSLSSVRDRKAPAPVSTNTGSNSR